MSVDVVAPEAIGEVEEVAIDTGLGSHVQVINIQ